MKMICTALFLCQLCLGAIAEISVEPFSRFDKTVQLSNASGETIAAMRYLVFRGRRTDDNTIRKYGLYVIFDQVTGHFQWLIDEPAPDSPDGLSRALDSKTMHVYSSTEGIAIFWLDVKRLQVLNTRGDASNVEDAEVRALGAAADSPPSEIGVTSPRWRTVALQGIDSFWGARNSSFAGPLKILNVSRRSGEWDIVIEGQWKEMLTLNENDALVRMSRLAPQ